MNPLTHTQMEYTADIQQAYKKVNDRRFRRVQQYGSFYEFSMAKKKIRMTQALPLAHTILQFAKLTMNRFYFDFMLKYLKRDKFILTETDTGQINLISLHFHLKNKLST